MAISGNVSIPVEEAIGFYDAIAGVTYLNKDHYSDEPATHSDPYAYKCAYTAVDCFLCDALPLDENLQPFEGYECPVPVCPDSFGDAIDYDNPDC